MTFLMTTVRDSNLFKVPFQEVEIGDLFYENDKGCLYQKISGTEARCIISPTERGSISDAEFIYAPYDEVWYLEVIRLVFEG